MRLIDERDVVARLETVYGLRGAVKEEVFCAVDACKTIDAIPVEWLTQQEYGEDEELSVAANTVLKVWLMKEQGVKE